MVGIVAFFAFCFYIGITNPSAIQRYRDLHEFRKTELDDNTSRTTVIQERIFDNTDAVTTEKASNVTVNQSSTVNFSIRPTISRSSAIQRYRNLHGFRKPNLMNDETPKTNNIEKNNTDDTGVKKTSNNAKTMTPSLFWSLIRFPSETGLSLPTILRDDLSSTDESGITTSTVVSSPPITPLETTASNTVKPIAIRTTTVIPTSKPTRKSPVPIFGCTTTCGSCTEITPISGVIMSPNYPEHYYSHSDIGYTYCQYNINAPVGKRIHLVFQELNLAFTDWSDFVEVVDKSPGNYGKALATFNAGDEAASTTTTGESMLVYFEGNRGGYTKNGRPPAWRATYHVVEK